jgi:hypothetical protein
VATVNVVEPAANGAALRCTRTFFAYRGNASVIKRAWWAILSTNALFNQKCQPGNTVVWWHMSCRLLDSRSYYAYAGIDAGRPALGYLAFDQIW